MSWLSTIRDAFRSKRINAVKPLEGGADVELGELGGHTGSYQAPGAPELDPAEFYADGTRRPHISLDDPVEPELGDAPTTLQAPEELEMKQV